MKKLLKLLGVIPVAAAVAVSFTACGEHVHKWGGWHRSETEHWRVCATCKEEQRSNHSNDADGNGMNHVCDDCAEFKALGFGFTEGGDAAHADFAREANVWFSAKGKELGFIYDCSTDFGLMNDENLENYDLVMFLNNKPSTSAQWEAFKKFMDNGGAWMGFHSAAFAMYSAATPTLWDIWYHEEFLRSGEYGNRPRDPSDGGFAQYWNTWNPTSEPLKVETYDHCATRNLELEDDTFLSSPCEWYAWANDLFEDENTTVLLSMNPTPENPAGDDTRADSLHQVWRGGHHPIAWANNGYKMVYMNWGHNLQDYNFGEEGKSSSTFCREAQNQFMLDAMFGLTE